MATNDSVVYVLDDEPSVCAALARIIRAGGAEVETFTSAKAFLGLRERRHPACLVVDVRMPEMNGLDLVARLRYSDDYLPVVFISGHATIQMSVQAMKRGAVDFLTKPVEPDALLTAIARGIARDAATSRERLELIALEQRFDRLTPREREVFALVVHGLLNKQAAARLGTTEQTVKVHRGRVMRKMEASSLAQLVSFAARLGFGLAAAPTGSAALWRGPSSSTLRPLTQRDWGLVAPWRGIRARAGPLRHPPLVEGWDGDVAAPLPRRANGRPAGADPTHCPRSP